MPGDLHQPELGGANAQQRQDRRLDVGQRPLHHAAKRPVDTADGSQGGARNCSREATVRPLQRTESRA
jgi:hypothetical protein